MFCVSEDQTRTSCGRARVFVSLVRTRNKDCLRIKSQVIFKIQIYLLHTIQILISIPHLTSTFWKKENKKIKHNLNSTLRLPNNPPIWYQFLFYKVQMNKIKKEKKNINYGGDYIVRISFCMWMNNHDIYPSNII